MSQKQAADEAKQPQAVPMPTDRLASIRIARDFTLGGTAKVTRILGIPD